MENFLKKLKLNMLYPCLILISCIFFIINMCDINSKLIDIPTINKYIIIYLTLAIILSIGTFLIIIKIKNIDIDNNKLPKLFIILGFTLGFIYLGLSPLFSGSDEHNHFYRIYEITEGVMITPTNKVVGSKLPESLYNTFNKASENNTNVKYKHIKDMAAVSLNKNKTMQYGNLWSNAYNNTALYSPIQYFPQTIGFVIGKFLGIGPYWIGMLGRVFNLIFFVMLGFYSLKIIPKSKLFYMMILLSPNMLQCATTLSADAFTNVIFLLLIAYIFKLCYNKKIVTTKEQIIILLLSIIISLCKIVYLPIVFLILLINSNQFKNGKKGKIFFSIVTIVLSIIVSLAWMNCTNGVFAIAYDKTEIQKRFIFGNIFSYIMIFIRTFINYIVKYIECLFVGTTMYHSQLQIPSIVSFLYVGIVILSMINEKVYKKLSDYKKIIIAGVGIIIVGLISTAIYIQCTAQYFSVGNPTIEGIQGRYFIPVVMLLPFIFNFKRVNIKSTILLNSALVINLITWFYMISRFII